MKRYLAQSLAGVLAFGVVASVHAKLIDRGNGMIYDSDQDLTWLQDANFMMNSGSANGSGGSYASDGRVDWMVAYSWVTELTYGGYDDWRMPELDESGIKIEPHEYGGINNIYIDPYASELAYMFQINLGNESMFNPDFSINPKACIPNTGCSQNSSADGVEILNLFGSNGYGQNYYYGTVSEILRGRAWFYNTHTNSLGTVEVGDNPRARVWAVRDGDVASVSVPEPSVVLLMISGLAGLGVTRGRL
ncbi:MAG: DUF1566 domain-containing protein [Candidatus Thiodiazotropha lotti]|nr:DUF1566 domain-containing protein [Candidatus Thiodiazotropha lotti]